MRSQWAVGRGCWDKLLILYCQQSRHRTVGAVNSSRTTGAAQPQQLVMQLPEELAGFRPDVGISVVNEQGAYALVAHVWMVHPSAANKLPLETAKRAERQLGKGQVQHWFLFKFTADDSDT